MPYEIALTEFGSAAYREMVAFRYRLLRAPLGLRFTDEQLAAENGLLHLALRDDNALIGTLLLVPPDEHGTARLRQMAVELRFERRGLGRAMVRRGEQELLQLGATQIALNAREPAIGFYRKLGYSIQGGIFIELTIPHVLMVKRLEKTKSDAGAAD